MTSSLTADVAEHPILSLDMNQWDGDITLNNYGPFPLFQTGRYISRGLLSHLNSASIKPLSSADVR